jgi:hypothetical protein
MILAHIIIRLFIWHFIWKFVLLLWHVPTAGPYLVVLLGCALVGLVVWRKQRRTLGGSAATRWLPGGHRPRGGLARYGTGGGPRDW